MIHLCRGILCPHASHPERQPRVEWVSPECILDSSPNIHQQFLIFFSVYPKRNGIKLLTLPSRILPIYYDKSIGRARMKFLHNSGFTRESKPIAITSVPSKVLRRLIVKWLSRFLNLNKSSLVTQVSFRKKMGYLLCTFDLGASRSSFFERWVLYNACFSRFPLCI